VVWKRVAGNWSVSIIFCWHLAWTWKHRANKPHACRWPAALLATVAHLGNRLVAKRESSGAQEYAG
jgi:hypothetical protein